MDFNGRLARFRDQFQSTEHPRTQKGAPRGTGGEFASKGGTPITLHGNIDPWFVQDVQRVYDSAPKTVRDYLQNTKLHAFDSVASLRKSAKMLAQELGLAPDTEPLPAGLQAITYTNDRTGKSSISFVSGTMLKQHSADERKKIVFHEMMHVIDHQLNISRSPDFREAYVQDVEALKDLYSTADAFQRNIMNHYAYFLDAPNETFAEIGARYLHPPANEQDRTLFNSFFPNARRVGTQQLFGAGIIGEAIE